jgi:FkbM family methyltransferase
LNNFVSEAGGYNGEKFSNSLYFELKRNWKGILIEPIPDLWKMLTSKNRKAFAINACIAHRKPLIARFKIGDSLSGRDDAMDDAHKKRLKNENPIDRSVSVPCFSLNTILQALGVKKVDMFSLDVEGGEYDVLKTIDFNKLDISTFVIEHNGRSTELERFRDLFNDLRFGLPQRPMYSEIKADGQDVFFLKNLK